jgi:hypothetical protein
MALLGCAPLLANVYLHYLFDLWVEAWRRKVARGQVVVVRLRGRSGGGVSAQSRCRERFLNEFRERLAKFGRELHPEKTRLLEFGRFAAVDRRKRGEKKPDHRARTFDLGRKGRDPGCRPEPGTDGACPGLRHCRPRVLSGDTPGTAWTARVRAEGKRRKPQRASALLRQLQPAFDPAVTMTFYIRHLFEDVASLASSTLSIIWAALSAPRHSLESPEPIRGWARLLYCYPRGCVRRARA